jgi:branched-chain amino acid transport system ATP-binding protein
VQAVADELLERVGITHVAHDRVDAMPTGLARLVELARALAARPRALLLDEPGSGLDDNESQAFARLLVELADEGLGVLIVEHDVDLVMSVCKNIFVLDFGEIIARGTPRQIQEDPRVQAAYLGTAPAT